MLWKINFTALGDFPWITHVRNCEMGATPMSNGSNMKNQNICAWVDQDKHMCQAQTYDYLYLSV